jgi:metallophosphoesterase superfamily enzyme
MPRRIKLPHIQVCADLHYEAKQVAAREGVTLTEIASRGLELALREYQTKTPKSV